MWALLSTFGSVQFLQYIPSSHKTIGYWCDRAFVIKNSINNSNFCVNLWEISQNDSNTWRRFIYRRGSNTQHYTCIVTFRYLYFLALFAAIGGFLFGYDTGVISGAMIPIKRKFHLSYEMQEVIVSITLVGAIIGAASSAYFNDRFGRRAVLLLASALFTVGSVCMGAAEQMASIIVGRMFVGLGIGIFIQLHVMYVHYPRHAELENFIISSGYQKIKDRVLFIHYY